MKEMSLGFRYVNISLACLQNMTSGGILFGWAAISSSLLLSSTENGGPGLTREYVHVMFTFASFFNFLGPLLLGIVLDLYGPRICSIVSISLIAIGCILFGYSDIESNPMFIPAMCLIAFGGPGAQNAIIHLSNLFPTWKATATAFITGSFQISFFVFVAFEYLWMKSKIDYCRLFIGYSVICAVNIVISVIFWPDKPYLFNEELAYIVSHPDDFGPGCTTIQDPIDLNMKPTNGAIRLPSRMIIRSDDDLFVNNSVSELDAKNHPKKMQIEMMKSKSPSQALPTSSLLKSYVASHHEKDVMYKPAPFILKEGSIYEQLTSPAYAWITIFFLINSFWANFYIGNIDLQLGDSELYTAEEQKTFGRMFTAIMTCGFIAIPIVGAVMDKYGFPMTSLFTAFFGIVWSICLLSKSRSSAVPSFISYALFRTFLFTFLFAYLADVFGFKYFGILGGLMFVLGGLLSLTQYSLTAWAAGTCHSFETPQPGCSNGYWDTINLVQLLSQFALLTFTYQDWIRRRREAVVFSRVKSRNNTSETGYGAVATADNA